MNTRKASIPAPTIGDLIQLLVKLATRQLAILKPVVTEWAIRALRAADICAREIKRIVQSALAHRWLRSSAFRSPTEQGVKLAPPSGNQLAVFKEAGCYGLRTPQEQLLPPEYDAVWPMLGGNFWGFRKGEDFGVVAADGEEVISCSLPARYQGYRELTAEDEYRALQVNETRFLSYLREQYLGLHITGSKLCQPAAWMVEELTPYLERAHNSLSFETPEFTLLLSDKGTWAWLKPPTVPKFKNIVHATPEPLTFSEKSPLLFTEATTNFLLDWRLRYRRPEGVLEEEEEARWEQEINDKVAAEYDQLVEVPTITADWWQHLDTPYYLFFTPENFAPHVLPTCLQHLQAFPAIHRHNRQYVERLIYLAWLWANGFVQKTYLPPYYVVDARYIIDNEWFDNVPIQEVYLSYQLQALEPLLSEIKKSE